MQCKQAHEYAHIKCNQSKFMSLLPLLVCFSCPRILILLHSSMLLPLCPCLTSTSPHDAFTYLCFNFSLFIINFYKRCASFDTKDCIGVDGWHLNLAFFMDTTTYVGMTPLVTLEIPYLGSFDLDTNLWDTSPYVIAWVIQLISLSSCRWGNFLHLMIT